MIKKTLFGILKSVLCVLLCMSVVLSCASYLLGLFLDEKSYSKNVANDKYVNQMYEIVIDRLESDSLYYDVPFEYISAAVDRDELSAISKEYVLGMVRSFKSGEAVPQVKYNREHFVAGINKYLSDYPEIGEYYEEETIQEIADEFNATVNHAINAFIKIDVLENVARSVYSNKIIYLIADSFWVVIVAAILCIVGIVVLNLKEPFLAVYRVFGAVWCGSVFLVIPSYLIKKNDFLANLILETGPFKTLIDGIYNLLLESWLKYSSVLFIVSSVLLVISIILIVLKPKICKETEVVENEKN